MTGPVTYNEASAGNIADQMDRYRELAEHDTMARSIAILKTRGTFEPSKHVNDEKFPPLTVAGYLEMLALGERIARYYRHPSQVDKTVKDGPAGSRSRLLPGPRRMPPGPLTASGRRASTGSTRTRASAWMMTSTPPRSRRPAPEHRAVRHDRP
jgi:hypothetical protein